MNKMLALSFNNKEYLSKVHLIVQLFFFSPNVKKAEKQQQQKNPRILLS